MNESGKPILTAAPSRVADSLSEVKQPERVEIEYPSIVRLRLKIPARYVVNGEVTNQRYEFSGAGDIQEIVSEDAPALLAKRRGNTCCGPNNPQAVFELVE